MRNVYLTSAIFLILMILYSTTPSCQGQEQPQVARVAHPDKPPRPPVTPVPHPPKPPRPPVTPVPHPPTPPGPPDTPEPHPPSPPGPPDTPEPHPPGPPPPHSLLQAVQSQVVRSPRPPKRPMPPMPPRPPRPPPRSLLQVEPKCKTCYRFYPAGCEQKCKENGFETKYSYCIKRKDSIWECCCPH